jgi:hypothetical protein
MAKFLRDYRSVRLIEMQFDEMELRVIRLALELGLTNRDLTDIVDSVEVHGLLKTICLAEHG